eukprot:scaffold102902_cov15-Tisochrysis_lutea.AAC.1
MLRMEWPGHQIRGDSLSHTSTQTTPQHKAHKVGLLLCHTSTRTTPQHKAHKVGLLLCHTSTRVSQGRRVVLFTPQGEPCNAGALVNTASCHPQRGRANGTTREGLPHSTSTAHLQLFHVHGRGKSCLSNKRNCTW